MAAQIWARVNSVVGRQEVKGDSELSLSPDVINDHFQTVAITKQHRNATDYNLQYQSTIDEFSQLASFYQ